MKEVVLIGVPPKEKNNNNLGSKLTSSFNPSIHLYIFSNVL